MPLKGGFAMQTTAHLYNHVNTIGDIAASRNCLSFQPDQFVKLILKAMQSSRTGSAGVVDDDGNLVGMLTEREILRRVFAMIDDRTIDHSKLGKYIDDMIVRDVMISNPRILSDNVDIEDALEIMTRLGFRYMPVVSRFDGRKLLGVVDEREVAIHVKNRLDQVKEDVEKKSSLLSYFFREPYGTGYSVST
jgi:CBS domain-containing protein